MLTWIFCDVPYVGGGGGCEAMGVWGGGGGGGGGGHRGGGLGGGDRVGGGVGTPQVGYPRGGGGVARGGETRGIGLHFETWGRKGRLGGVHLASLGGKWDESAQRKVIKGNPITNYGKYLLSFSCLW